MLRLGVLRVSLSPIRWQRSFVLPRVDASASTRAIQSNIRARRKPDGQPQGQMPSTWPVAILRNAYQSNVLDIDTAIAIPFLDAARDAAISGRLNKAFMTGLLQEHRMEVEDLSILGRLLVVGTLEKRIRELGYDFLTLASDLGNEAAAFTLITLSIEKKQSMTIGTLRYQRALSHVKRLANGRNNVQALAILGKVYEEAGQYDDALRIYKEAIEIHRSRDVFEDERTALAESFRNAGRILLIKSGQEKIALEYFEIAAREYEEPASFYYMALMKGEHHPDYEQLLSQAAISGTLEASYELGLWHSKQADKAYVQTGNKASDAYSMAIHWFELAKLFSDLKSRAMLHIARIHRVRTMGNIVEVSEPVVQAMKDVFKSDETIMDLVKEWPQPNSSLTATELEMMMEDSQNQHRRPRLAV